MSKEARARSKINELLEEAEAEGMTPITLINGSQLVDLLIQYKVGVKQEQYTVPSIDVEYWMEVLGYQYERAVRVKEIDVSSCFVSLHDSRLSAIDEL